MSLPLVSICIPVYNGEPYIFEALNSAVNQTYKNLEILIFDNCSTDRTAEIIKSFNDSRISYHLNDKNYGGLYNHNKCLESANGEFIKLLSADDLLKPEAIEKQVDILINNPDVSICITATNVINAFDEVIMKRQLYKKSLKINGRKIAKKSLMSGRNFYGEPSCVLFRKDKSRQVGYFDDILITDLEYWVRLSRVGDVYYINEFLSDWRLSSTNYTSNFLSIKDVYKNTKLFLVYWDKLLKKHSEFNGIKLNKFEKMFSKIAVLFMSFLKFIFILFNKIKQDWKKK